MRREHATMLLALALLVTPTPLAALEAPAPTDGAEITSMQSGLDEAMVSFEGEVVSELLSGDDEHVWVNVLSGGTAIGVWAPRDLADDIVIFGDWKHDGDRVRVTGVLNEGCDQHGGDLDVHASSIELLERGMERERPYELWKLGIGAAGLFVAYIGWRRMRRAEEGDTL